MIWLHITNGLLSDVISDSDKGPDVLKEVHVKPQGYVILKVYAWLMMSWKLGIN